VAPPAREDCAGERPRQIVYLSLAREDCAGERPRQIVYLSLAEVESAIR